MAGNHVLSISSFFKDNMKQFKRGEIADKDGHILKFLADLEQNIVVGDVKPSMKSDPYKVRILLNEGSISDAHCSCSELQFVTILQLWHCIHIITLVQLTKLAHGVQDQLMCLVI
ncbi:unnamed protein product [Macrosiphum euphorbiae]|uniref:SWIM-type domain-containing protein n=1 Tax=Macrosiphum euphorbiae TaxID=13131 RepID=A0AAV0WJE9_9HEMI|nr:unnamed protein product [Macrosiphum euphorbiae]